MDSKSTSMDDLQSAIDKARDDAISRVFGVLLDNLIGSEADKARPRFAVAFARILQAHRIATAVAKEAQK